MKEATVEGALKMLEGWGFKQLKLKTPGTSGTKDRLILMPTWAPAPPAFVELKRPGKEERPLQAAVRDDWRARGCDVRDMCDTVFKVHLLCSVLLVEAVWRYNMKNDLCTLPVHIAQDYGKALHFIRSKNDAT